MESVAQLHSDIPQEGEGGGTSSVIRYKVSQTPKKRATKGLRQLLCVGAWLLLLLQFCSGIIDKLKNVYTSSVQSR